MDSPEPSAVQRSAIAFHEVLDPQMVAVLRAKTPAEKVAMIAAARRTALMLAAAGERVRHPQWSEAEIRAAAIRRISGGTR